MITMIVACSMMIGRLDDAATFSSPVDKEKLARFLWKGLRNRQEHLRRGVFSAHGRKKIVEKGQRLEGDVELFAAFDLNAGLRRFDRSEPQIPLKNSAGFGERSSSADLIPIRIATKWISTPTKNIDWMDAPNSANGDYAVVSAPSTKATSLFDPFDVSCLGIVNWNRDAEALDFDFLLKTWTAMENVEIIREPNGLYRFTGLHLPQKFGKRVLWLDETKDFAPVRMESYQRWPNQKDWVGPVFLSELTWTKISGVWVPKTFRNVKNLNDLISYDLVFDWRSVNQPVPSDLFDVHGMNLPKGTFVSESRNGKSYFSEVIGRPDYPLLPPPTQSKPARRSLHAPVLAAVGGIAAVAGAALFLARRRGRRRNSLDAG